MGTYKLKSPTSQEAPPIDEFISGLECVETIGGGCLRFILFVNKTVDGQVQRVRAERALIMPIDALPDAIGKAMMALGRQVFIRPDGTMTLMH